MAKPTLNDPKEYAIVKSIYFPKDNINNEDIDSLERLDRQESKSHNITSR